jgi:Zn-finger nucleic acid-binding protein
VAYRESFESCPRCGTALEDAGDVRACSQCRGQWVLETVLAEMVMEMVPAGEVGRLVLVPVAPRGSPTGCPSCGAPMDMVSMYGVEVERCPKQHGVWFDPEELQAGLNRAADPVQHSQHVAQAASERSSTDVAREIKFAIESPGVARRELVVRQQAIKIGRLDVCHVQLSDERVAGVHAIVLNTETAPVLQDIGSTDGTIVNGDRVFRHTLVNGDLIRIGATTITVTFETS